MHILCMTWWHMHMLHEITCAMWQQRCTTARIVWAMNNKKIEITQALKLINKNYEPRAPREFITLLDGNKFPKRIYTPQSFPLMFLVLPWQWTMNIHTYLLPVWYYKWRRDLHQLQVTQPSKMLVLVFVLPPWWTELGNKPPEDIYHWELQQKLHPLIFLEFSRNLLL